MRRAITLPPVLGLLALTAAACDAGGSVQEPTDGPVAVGLQEVAAGLNFPLYLTAPPGDSRLFIVEKGGLIRIVKDGSLLPTPFLDLTPLVSTGGEQGLLGLAFDPAYATDGRFVVHYTDVNGNTTVATYRVSAGDPDQADPSSATVVLTAEQPFANHNGGQILFGPDGMLYIGLGDGGSGGDPGGRGQSLTDLLGDILRVDVASGTGYTVPADNPFVGRTDARPEVWSYGLRNPWRFTFDPATGDLYIADVGQNAWEEVDVVTAADGAGRGANFGWNVTEGRHCYASATCDLSLLYLAPGGILARQRRVLHHRRLCLSGRCHSRAAGALFLRRLLPGLGPQLPAGERPGGGALSVAHLGARRRGAELRAGRGGRAVRDELGGTGIPDRAAASRRLRGAGRPLARDGPVRRLIVELSGLARAGLPPRTTPDAGRRPGC